METIAVTGATGYLGENLIAELVKRGYSINAIARNEGKLVALKDKFKNINIYPCPIEDSILLRNALKDCHGIFHLAALKDVHLANKNVLKCVQTNIIGSLNLLKLSIELPNIKFILATSTDKAAKVKNVYGASKYIMENLFYDFEKMNGDNCKYRVVRFGNILYSTGSVLERWKYALENNKEIILTDPLATRFFISREQALKIMLQCLNESNTSEVFYPKDMKSVEMETLLNMMVKKYGKGSPAIKIIGLQEGENKHEIIGCDISSKNARRWSVDELYEMI